jgi:hypothetical protein
MIGTAVPRPLPVRLQQRVLDRVLTQIELLGAVPSQQGAEDLRRSRPQQVLDAP